jgi:RNase adapter protein RapZ
VSVTDPAPQDPSEPGVDAPSARRILVITGMSGAGRSTVSDVVEDLGWYVIDNLPPTLIGPVVELAFAPGSSVDRLALVTDARGRQFFATLMDAIATLRSSDADVRVLFLEADDDALVRRFEETRRRHPAADEAGVLVGIARERELLRDLRGAADLIIDTSGTNVHQLRDRIVEALAGAGDRRLHIDLVSFGFKRGAPREADLLFDVRFLPNPHWDPTLRELTGLDEDVRRYVFDQPSTGPFVAALEALIDVALPGYVQEGKHYLTIAIGCTGGKHRSVALVEHLAAHLRRTSGLPVDVRHRDLGAE